MPDNLNTSITLTFKQAGAPQTASQISAMAQGLAKSATEVTKLNKAGGLKALQVDPKTVKGLTEASDLVTRVATDVANFQKGGGLAALAVGQEQIAAAQARIAEIGLELRDATIEAARLGAELSQATTFDERQQLQRSIVGVEARVTSLRAELAKLPTDLKEATSQSVGFLGDIDSSLATLSGTLAGIGSSPLGRIAGSGIAGSGLVQGIGPLSDLANIGQLGADIFAAAEAVPRLSAALSVAKARLLENVVATGAQALATQGTTAAAVSSVVPLNATAAGIVTITAAAAPLILIGAALAAGYLALQESTNSMVEAIDSAVAATEERLRAEFQYRDDLENLTLEQAQLRQQQLQDEIAITRARIAALQAEGQAQLDGASNFELGVQGVLAGWDALLGTDFSVLTQVENQGEDLTTSLTDLEAALSEYNSQVVRQLEVQEALNNAQQTGEAAAEDFLATEQAGIEARHQLIDDIRNLTSEELAARLEELNTRAIIQNELSQSIRAERQRLQDEVNNLSIGSDGIENAADLFVAAESYRVQLNALTEALNESEAEASNLNDQIGQYTHIAGPAITAREAETNALEATRAAEAARVDQLRATQEALRANNQALTEALFALQEQADAWAAQDALNASRTAQLNDLNTALENAIAAEKQADLVGKLRETQQAGQQAVREQQQTFTTRITQLDQDFQSNLASLYADYQQQNAKALQERNEDEEKALREYQRNRKRLLADLDDDLLQAQADNDVNAFIAAQKAAEEAQQRQDEDFNDASAERARAFEKERQERERALQERLNDLRQSYQAERVLAAQENNARLLQIREQVMQRLQALNEGAKEEVKLSARIREQITALQARFAEEDARAQRVAQRRALQERILEARNEQQRLLDEQRRYAQARVDTEAQVQGAFVGLAQKAASAIGSLFSGGASSPTRTASRSSRPNIFRNAEGGIYTQPTLAQLGEAPGKGDVVIPFSTQSSEGITRAFDRVAGRMSNTPQIVVNMGGVAVGENVTQSDLKRVMGEFQTGLLRVVSNLALETGRS